MRKNAYNELLSTAKCDYEETAKLSFKNAAGNSENLRLVKVHPSILAAELYPGIRITKK